MKPRIGNGLIVLALVTGVALLGVAGMSLAASDHGATASQGDQAPIGEFSAGGSPGSGRVPGDSGGGSKGDAGSGTNPDDKNGVKDDAGSGSGPNAVKSAGGAGGGSLPFTGFLAIPVLLLGLMLLGAGAVLRRRGSEPTGP